MARKKSDPPDTPMRGHAVVVKGTPEWKEWVEAAAKHCRTTVSTFVDQALSEHAKSRGYDVPPPPR